jgi:prepilin-type N-terminal cleavage/methylation domain-containing protein
MKRMRTLINSKGFTLIELLLVVGIIGVLLAVVIPKAIRANINAKYGIVDKNANELKSYAVQWAEKSIRAQDEEQSTATLADYYASLAGAANGIVAGASQQWIATAAANNWHLDTPGDRAKTNFLNIQGRYQVVGNAVEANRPPEDSVEHLVPPEKNITNPFNGTSVFRQPNDPDTIGGPVTGALALGFAREPVPDGGFYYFAFAYQGTDSTTTALNADDTTFYAGSGLTQIDSLKNGILFARIR